MQFFVLPQHVIRDLQNFKNLNPDESERRLNAGQIKKMESWREEGLTPVTCLTLVLCKPDTHMSSLDSLVLIVEPNLGPLCSLECEILCFYRILSAHIM